MNDEISQPVPQGSDRAQEAENRRIAAIADELERLCSVYEAQSGNGQSHVSHFDAEQRVAEQMAKESGFWIPMMDIFDLGVPGPSGHENNTYVVEKSIFKVNNLLNSGSIVASSFASVNQHVQGWFFKIFLKLLHESIICTANAE